MKKDTIIILSIILFIVVMAAFSVLDDSYNIKDSGENKIVLSQKQTELMRNLDIINIGFSDDMKYLTVYDEDTNTYGGFLYDYMAKVWGSIGKDIKLVYVPQQENQPAWTLLEQNEQIHCMALLVTESLRDNIEQISVTKPVFQVNGSMFITTAKTNDELFHQKSLSGISISGELTENAKDSLKYNGVKINLVEANSVEKAVEMALETNADLIIGNETAIANTLIKNSAYDRYHDLCVSIYEKNVCIAVDRSSKIFFYTINNIVNSTDLDRMLRQLQGKWFGLPSSFAKEDMFKETSLILLIMIASVLCALFIYYQSSKNLYDELSIRMEQLVASQKEMDTTFNGVSYYMAELDENGYILAINKAFLRFLEVSKNEMLGKNIASIDAFPEDTIEMLNNVIDETVKNRAGQSLEISIKRRIIEINTFPIENQKWKTVKILFMASDVTGLRAAERQMLQGNKMIAIGQLAAGVAHEIRNPLGIIRNYCYVIKHMEPIDKEKLMKVIQIIEKCLDASGRIIDNLLNFSRISSSEKEEIYIREHIDSMILLNEMKLKENLKAVNIFCEDDFKVNICVESLDIVLINLISNAIDASKINGIIDIKLLKSTTDFSISISDNGIGIEPELISEVYNPFFTTKEKREGNGLGLYIVYNEVQKMNGTIDLESEPGVGTTFTITLPLE